jgi:hypothetical protein
MIYTDIAKTLANARARASSVTQLIMIDRVVMMIADTLGEYKNFNVHAFLDKACVGHGVPITNELETQ